MNSLWRSVSISLWSCATWQKSLSWVHTLWQSIHTKRIGGQKSGTIHNKMTTSYMDWSLLSLFSILEIVADSVRWRCVPVMNLHPKQSGHQGAVVTPLLFQFWCSNSNTKCMCQKHLDLDSSISTKLAKIPCAFLQAYPMVSSKRTTHPGWWCEPSNFGQLWKTAEENVWNRLGSFQSPTRKLFRALFGLLPFFPSSLTSILTGLSHFIRCLEPCSNASLCAGTSLNNTRRNFGTFPHCIYRI